MAAWRAPDDDEQRDQRLEDMVDRGYDGCTDYDWSQQDAVTEDMKRQLAAIRGMANGVALSVLIWAAILALVYTGLHV